MVKYLQCYGTSLRINIHLSRQNTELYNKCLFHLYFPMRENPQLYGVRAFLSILEKEGPIHRSSNVSIDEGKSVSTVRAKDYPSNL